MIKFFFLFSFGYLGLILPYIGSALFIPPYRQFIVCPYIFPFEANHFANSAMMLATPVDRRVHLMRTWLLQYYDFCSPQASFERRWGVSRYDYRWIGPQTFHGPREDVQNIEQVLRHHSSPWAIESIDVQTRDGFSFEPHYYIREPRPYGRVITDWGNGDRLVMEPLSYIDYSSHFPYSSKPWLEHIPYAEMQELFDIGVTMAQHL